MARPLRIEFPGAIYHVTSRGNARQDIYLNDGDRRLFLDVLSATVEKYNWVCHAYCLMGNHYHLLLETPDPNLSLGMRQLNGVYTQRFNRSHDRVGHVFQGRFKAILVEKQSHLLELCRYIVLNPVAVHVVSNPADYVWSSYRYTAKPVKSPDFLFSDWVLGQFSSHKREARKHYQDFVSEGIRIESEKPWKNLTGQIILGGESFVAEMQELLGEKQEIKEVPKAQRYPGRPSLENLFSGQKVADRKKRNSTIQKAHYSYGYTLKEIGDYLGVHYTTVSRATRLGSKRM